MRNEQEHSETPKLVSRFRASVTTEARAAAEATPIPSRIVCGFALNETDFFTAHTRIKAKSQNTLLVLSLDFDDTMILEQPSKRQKTVVLNLPFIHQLAALLNATSSLENVVLRILSARPDDATIPAQFSKIADALPLFCNELNQLIAIKHPSGIQPDNISCVCLQKEMLSGKNFIYLAHKESAKILHGRLLDANQNIEDKKTRDEIYAEIIKEIKNSKNTLVHEALRKHPERYHFIKDRFHPAAHNNKAFALFFIILPKLYLDTNNDFLLIHFDDNVNQIAAIERLEHPNVVSVQCERKNRPFSLANTPHHRFLTSQAPHLPAIPRPPTAGFSRNQAPLSGGRPPLAPK